MKGVLLGLLLCNLVYLSWQWLVPGAALLNPPLDPGSQEQPVGVGDITMLSEAAVTALMPYVGPSDPALETVVDEALAETAEEEPVVEELATAEASAGFCAEIGPFTDMADAEGFVGSHAGPFSMSVETREVSAPPDYRVFLPPFASRELAAATLAQLRAAFAQNNLRIDTYLVPRGELANSIALGLFAEQDNAVNVQRQLQNLGYTVTVREESNTRQEVWVVVSGARNESEFRAHWEQIQLSRSYIRAGEKLC